MSRNLKKENLRKLHAIETRNGFRVDLLNYMYNPAHSYEYPGLIKTTAETETTITKTRFYYMKFWDGTGAYKMETYTGKKTTEENLNPWQIITSTDREEKTIEASNRFNLNRLIAIAESY